MATIFHREVDSVLAPVEINATISDPENGDVCFFRDEHNAGWAMYFESDDSEIDERRVLQGGSPELNPNARWKVASTSLDGYLEMPFVAGAFPGAPHAVPVQAQGSNALSPTNVTIYHGVLHVSTFDPATGESLHSVSIGGGSPMIRCTTAAIPEIAPEQQVTFGGSAGSLFAYNDGLGNVSSWFFPVELSSNVANWMLPGAFFAGSEFLLTTDGASTTIISVV